MRSLRRPHAVRLAPLVSLVLGLAVAVAGCGDPVTGPERDPYAYVAPPAAAVPAGLEAGAWSAHLVADLLPYWTMAAAEGAPEGNFPTWRRMDGAPDAARTSRKPRMMGRQVYTYCIAFMMTGEERYLDLARAGTRWLLDHGWDATRGGWHADLDASGAPLPGDAPKFAQDMAYAAMGPGAYYFVTRDPEAEAAVLATRDLLFDPATFWDAANGRIRDGRSADLSAEVFMSGTGNSDLVSQLDPITAFMLLSQPVLTDPARRAQWLGDLRTLGARMRETWWRDGFFWGTTAGVGAFGSRHSDFGHGLKAYWALLQIDKRLPDRPFAAFVADHAPRTMTLAFDATYGRWGERPTSATTSSYGNAWWSYAESDQIAATWALRDPAFIPVVAQTAPHFLDFVDDTRAARELVPSIRRDGSWVYPWPDADTAKCNEWKNGFHGAEHALVMSLFGHWLAGSPAPLYFAFPAARAAELAAAAVPYTFQGKVVSVEDLGPLSGDPARNRIRVSFGELR